VYGRTTGTNRCTRKPNRVYSETEALDIPFRLAIYNSNILERKSRPTTVRRAPTFGVRVVLQYRSKYFRPCSDAATRPRPHNRFFKSYLLFHERPNCDHNLWPKLAEPETISLAGQDNVSSANLGHLFFHFRLSNFSHLEIPDFLLFAMTEQYFVRLGRIQSKALPVQLNYSTPLVTIILRLHNGNSLRALGI
jgi:hypothetical protein